MNKEAAFAPTSERQPLTPEQIGLWKQVRSHPTEPVGSQIVQVEWRMALNVEAFRSAFAALVARTDALQLVFGETEGRPWQAAIPGIAADVALSDFSQADDPLTEALGWFEQRSRQVLDIARCCFDSALARLGPDRWLWFLNQHHLTTDRRTIRLNVARLSDLYQCALRGELLEQLAPYPAFMPHLAALSRNLPAAAGTKGAVPAPYGAEVLGFPLPPGSDVSFYQRSIAILPAAELASLGRQSTEFTTFAAALAALVLRAGEGGAGEGGEATLGIVSHNRYAPGSEDVAGFFLRNHAMVLPWRERMTLADLAAEVRTVRRSVFAEVRKGTAPRAQALQAALNYTPDPLPDFASVPSLEHPIHIVPPLYSFPLRLGVRAGLEPGSLRLEFDVSARLAQAAGGIEAVVRQFLVLYRALLLAPDSILAEVPLIEADGLRSRARAARAAAAPAFATLPAAFLAQAVRQPDAPALSEGDRSWSYAEVEAETARIARHLRRLGAGPGEVVAICLPRSAAFVMAFLGVMRSGAAACVLDSVTPELRLRSILEATDPVAALANQPLPGEFPVLRPEELERQAGAAPLPPPEGSATAYYVFTSGSTGEPKGVAIRHEAVARFLDWYHRDVIGLERPVCALPTALSFDATYRFLAALWSGGEVRVYPERVGEIALAEVLREDVCDTVHATPSQLTSVLVTGAVPGTTRLRVLVSLGESLPRRLAADLCAILGSGVALVNCYGPTEAAMASTAYRFDPARDGPARGLSVSVPVGHPPADVWVQVMDPAGNPLPPGLLGEVWIGGLRVAAGYLNRPDQTALAFHPDPFAGAGAMYRTGDLGRMTADATLVLQGRADDQIKVNGVRVEPAEVERALRLHAEVQAAAVGLRGDPPVLIGWYVAGRDLPPAELRAAAAGAVIPAMIPRAFLRVPAIPMTPSGKTNRRALPDLPGAEPAGAVPAPADPGFTASEQVIAGLWQEILGQRDLTSRSNFFDLGGDSLAAIRLVYLLEDRFGIRLDLISLEQLATIPGTARIVTAAVSPAVPDAATQAQAVSPSSGQREDDLCALLGSLRALKESWPGEPVGPAGLIRLANATGTKPPLYWCFNGAGEFRLMAAELGPDQPLYGMRSASGMPQGASANLRLLQRLADYYAETLLEETAHERVAVGGNCQAAAIAMRLATTLMQGGRTVDLLVMMEAAPPVPYPGRVGLIFGRESQTHNPFFHFADPVPAWRRHYREVEWSIVPGAHGQFFRSDNIGPLCQAIAGHMDRAFAPPPPRQPKGSVQAGLRLVGLPAEVQCAVPLRVSVEIVNRGRHAWAPAVAGGVSLTATWTQGIGALRQPVLPVATLALPQILAPGKSCVVKMDVPAPATPGQWALALDLSEAGIGWLTGGTAPLLVQAVTVLPPGSAP